MDRVSSQYYSGAYARKCHEVCDGATGGYVGVAYAETFQSLFPSGGYALPVTGADLRRVSEPAEETMARRSESISARMPLPAGMGFSS